MICPKCNRKLVVTDTVCQDNVTYRRYRCNICGEHIHTEERHNSWARANLNRIKSDKYRNEAL